MSSLQIQPLDAGLFGIRTSYFSKALNEACKLVPGMRWSPESRNWYGYSDAIEQLREELSEKGVHLGGELPEADAWKSRDITTVDLTASNGWVARRYQEDGVRFILDKAEEGCLLADGMRVGKDQWVEEPVLTPIGFRRLGDIAVGDHVIGIDGQQTKVIAVHPQGRKKLFRVTFSDGATTTCGQYHLWAVRTPKEKIRGKDFAPRTLQGILDLGLQQKGTTNNKWFVPIPQAIEFSATSSLPVHPYVLGALLANGSLDRSPSHCGGEDQRDLMRPLLPDGCTFSSSLDKFSRNIVGARTVVQVLRETNLIDKRSWEKFIPTSYLHSSISDRIAILQGLFDNDGTVSQNGFAVEYNTTSPQLAANVMFLVRSLGGIAWMSTRIPTFTHKGLKKKGRRDYRIRVSLPPGLCPFRLHRKSSLFRPRTKFQPAHAIEKVEYVGKRETVCITVAASDGLYVTNDFIVTHNSAQASLSARHLAVKTLVVCPPNAVGVWARSPDDPKPGELAKWWPESWGSHNDGVVVLEGVALAKHQDLFWKISEKKEEKRSAEEKQKLKEANAVIQDALKKLQNAKVVVIHDQIIYAWVEVLLRWGFEFLIIDEAHSMSGYDTRRSISAKKLAAAARYRLATTGTPMTSRPRDLHNVIDLLCPGRFGAFFRHERQDGTFSKVFCGSHQEIVGKGPEAKTVWNHNGKSNTELLHRRLSRMMLRRTAKEVDTELPDKTRQVIDVRIPANKMVMPSMSNLGDRRALRRVLDLTADAKLRPVQDLLKSHLEEGLKVVAFCHRRIFAETLVSGSVKFGIENLSSTYVHGDVSQKERDRRIVKAEKHDGPFLFAATIESCSTAIDLSFADVIVFCELTWVPSDLNQAEERSYKFGDGRKRLIQYVLARGTGDELILRAVISKLADFETIVGSTGDRMKEDLAGKKDPDAALKRLAAAMEEMHRARPIKKKKQGILRA